MLLLIISAVNLSATDCIENHPSEWLEMISEGTVDSSGYSLEYAIACTYVGALMNLQYNPEFLTSDEELNKIYERNEKIKEEIYAIIPQYLISPIPEVRCNAAQALAFYRWPDSFSYLMACERNVTDLSLLVILGDQRAIPLIIEKYKNIRMTKATSSMPTKSLIEDAARCVEALYHFASPEILPFINSVINSSAEEPIQVMARKVCGRIHDLYPNTERPVDK